MQRGAAHLGCGQRCLYRWVNREMKFGLEGRRAIVTGSTSGIGLACAQQLAAEGAAVLICGRDPERLASALDTFTSPVATGVQADITTSEGRRRLTEICPEPDLLITNLSGPPPKKFFDTSIEDWSTVLNSHLLAPLELIRAVVPGMCERGFGRVINITSAMVLAPRPHHVLSTSARTALTAAVKAISLEVAAHNVTINNILPERVDTPRQEEMARAAMVREQISYEQARAAQLTSIAAQRLGRPEELGALCAFLCSDHAGYVSGLNVKFDGGSSPITF